MVKKYVIQMTDENGMFQDFCVESSLEGAEKSIEHFTSDELDFMKKEYRIDIRYSRK